MTHGDAAPTSYPLGPHAEPASGSSGSARPARVRRFAVGVVGWPLMMLGAVLTTAAIFWISLALVLLHAAPQGKALTGLAVTGGLTAATSFLVARFVTSWRIVWRAVGLVATLLLFAGAVWAASSQDRALFLARDMAWGESDVLDYRKFPARIVRPGTPAFHFRSRPSPELFRSVPFTVDGKARKAPLDELLRTTQTTSFVVLQEGNVLFERYGNGYRRDSTVTSFSVAKSVTSALVGIAIDEGAIGSVDDAVVDYLPELRGRGFDRLTIRDLLRMSTGIRFVQDEDLGNLEELWPFRDVSLAYSYPNLRDLARHLRRSDEPVGAAFDYNPYHPILLGMILERTTHRPVARYLEEKLWRPLGMEYDGSWSLDGEDDAFEKMESGVNARAIDFAKLGRLYLDDGRWNGRRVISRRWIRASTAPDASDHRPFLSYGDWQADDGYYGYMWWGRRTPAGGYSFSARGHLGQRIAVFPENRVVIVRFGRTDGLDSWDDVIASVAARVPSPRAGGGSRP